MVLEFYLLRAYTRFMLSPCHCTNLRLATRKVSGLYDTALAPAGINVAQYSLLRTIAGHEPVSLTTLSRITDLDRSTIGRNVRVLERMDLVTLARGSDQREAVVQLSANGNKVLSQATPLWEACQKSVEERLGPQLHETVRAFLQAV
ncbi:MarR family winged helix-turn-helix transcriptional regulator [Komagataeibacter diospyri]|uniref:MarR family winged helix-turn-helix transcriptional regulator n=1 Tax=Komagataeibacter diospyri TaxID=1932662 RepID=UPI003756BE31